MNPDSPSANIIVIIRQAVGIERQGAQYPQGLVLLFPQIQYPIALDLIFLGIQHDQDTRPRTLHTILLDDHPNLTIAQFHQRPDRVEPDALNELLHQYGIEFLVTQLIKLFQRLLMAERIPIGLLLEHGAERIAQTGHLAAQTNLIEAQPARIAGTIPA